MKKIALLGTIILVTLLTFSCKKDSTTSNTSPTSSQWTIDGVTYKGDSTSFENNISDYYLASYIGNSASNNNIYITFGKKPVSGTYTVAESYYSPDSTEVGFQINNSNGFFTSTGAPGNTVSITIVGGKMTADFSNITIIGGAAGATTHVSGTLVATL